jgi:outer membrane biosynthesis protein TonB
MDSSSENIGVYAEAKGEYTKQLCGFLIPALKSYFLQMFELAKESKDEKGPIWHFQDLLKEIPDWNIDKVKRETEKIVNMTQCDYLEELLTAVFIAHTKVLSAIRLTSKQKKLQITVPKVEHFVHRVLCDAARLLWSNAFLFKPNIPSIDKQKNLNQVESLLQDGVLQTIRNMLPVKSILREYLQTDGEEEEAEEKAAEEKPEEEKPEEEKPEEEKPSEEKPAEEKPAEEKPAEEKPAEEKPAEETKQEGIAPPPAPSAISPASPTIIVDTEPSVRFSNIDTVFDPSNPENHTFRPTNTGEDEEHLEFIDDDGTGETIEDFETL